MNYGFFWTEFTESTELTGMDAATASELALVIFDGNRGLKSLPRTSRFSRAWQSNSRAELAEVNACCGFFGYQITW
jgi:hypothetical protein